MKDEAVSTPGPVRRWRAEPGASPRAIIAEHGQALTRVEVIADAILRVRVAPTGQLAAEASWKKGWKEGWEQAQPLSASRLITEERDGWVQLKTDRLRARLDLKSGAISPVSPEGLAYASDLGAVHWRQIERDEVPAIAPALGPALAQQADTAWPTGPASIGIWLQKGLHPQEGLFGCGQRFGPLNRRGQRLAHWTTDIHAPGLGVVDGCLYQSHPVLLALRPGLAWGLMLGSSAYSHFDLGAEQPEQLGLFTLGGELDYYLLAGPTPAAVVEQLTRLTGRPALPPLWALGYHQSRWGYRSDAEIRALADGFRTRRIPIDAIHLDIDYMDGFRVFSWNRERFPNPRATVAALHERNIRAVTIIDPGVKREADESAAAGACHTGAGYPVSTTGVREDHFIRRPSGALFSGYVWPGESLFPDFCRSRTRRWWGDLHAGLLDLGVDGIWCDMNEPAIVDRPFHCDGTTALAIPLDAKQGDDGESSHAEAHNLYGTLMARATYEGLQRLRPQRRPWVLTRSASLAAQRWAVSWMGDNASTWADLRASLPQLASMGLSGSPHVGVDIGGFYGACDGELFARWIELGAFYPFMRVHAEHSSPPQEPWSFGDEVEAVARIAIERRYQLLPYLYTLAHRAHRLGEPILRPLLYDFPDRAELQTIDDQLMIGPLLMIAPVCEPGRRTRTVRLPPGVWYDFHTGKLLDGDTPHACSGESPDEDDLENAPDIEPEIHAETAPSATARCCLLPAAPGRMPILVRGGSCLTLGPPRQATGEPLTALIVDAYPDAGEGTWTLTEDAGDGWDHCHDGSTETELRVLGSGTTPALLIGQRAGRWQPPPRQLVLRLHLAQAPTQLLFDGIPRTDWWWDQDQSAAILTLEDDGRAHRLSLE